MNLATYLKTALASLLLAATAFAIARFRTFEVTTPAGELASQCETTVGALVQIVNIDGMIPPAVKAFQNVGAALKADIVDFHARRPRVHPCAGTVFDDPSCQQFQEFEPAYWQCPWYAPAGNIPPSRGGYLLAW